MNVPYFVLCLAQSRLEIVHFLAVVLLAGLLNLLLLVKVLLKRFFSLLDLLNLVLTSLSLRLGRFKLVL